MEHHQALNLLDEALGLCKTMSSLSGRFLLVEDCVETSGAFVLHHLLKCSLFSSSSSVAIFIAFSNPFAHYHRVLTKLGCNLAAHKDNGRFFFIDMLMLQYPDEGKTDQDGLASLFEKIERVISTLHPDSMNSITIMIDDISLLEVAANGCSNSVLDFLHYCLTLTSEYACTVVALDHKDIYLGEEKPKLILELEYLTDILVKVEPLATGLAKDVHGQLMVFHKEVQNRHGSLPIKIQNFHFKIKENIVEYFYPGTKNYS